MSKIHYIRDKIGRVACGKSLLACYAYLGFIFDKLIGKYQCKTCKKIRDKELKKGD